MKVREMALMRRVDCTMTPSTFEMHCSSANCPDLPALVLPFMIGLNGTEIGFGPRRDICFLGGYRHGPNVDAVIFFVREVFPLIRAREPGIRFIVAGAQSTREILALACDDVIVTGMVDDLRDVFDARACSSAPARGAGEQGQGRGGDVVRAAGGLDLGGAEGMDLVDGEQVLLADDAAAFAEATCGSIATRRYGSMCRRPGKSWFRKTTRSPWDARC